ncbi:MAG: response regulator [Desulfuromonadales bacterium]|nr:response regulator [Desulfuromonadales bacterium]
MSIKILLADDSITIQKVVGIIFGGDEYALTVVDNGKAAVETAREINPDVLLIDALMPGMSGYEVCEAVRATPALSTKPILLLTGSFEPFDEDKAKSCGADDFLSKPFESQQIVSKVKELFEIGSSRTATPAPEPQPAAAPVVSKPADTPPALPIIEETIATGDIWDAFTEPEKPAPVETAPATATEPEPTGSQWIPVEEETFEFEEDTVVEPPAPAVNEPELVVEESAFGDVLFEAPASMQTVTEEVTPVMTPAAPAFSEPAEAFFTEPAPVVAEPAAPPVVPPVPVAPPVEPPTVVTPVSTVVPAALTEDQLREALKSASKEVIERIVWEVVPDLAEVMIKEAIRKIKEGV